MPRSDVTPVAPYLGDGLAARARRASLGFARAYGRLDLPP